jgi:hypothetical protein
MATYTLQTPSSPAFKAEGVRNADGFQATVIPFFTKSWKELEFIENNCKVPYEVVTALLVAVSKSLAPNPVRPATNNGLMGWSLTWGAPVEGKRLNARTVLNYEKTNYRMTANEEAKLIALGLKYNKEATKTEQKGWTEVTAALQANENFNMLYGAILLGQLMDSKGLGLDKFPNWAIDDRLNLHLERVIVVFLNGGDTSRPSVQKALSRRYDTALSLMNAIKAEDPFSASTISRVLGEGGYLTMLVKGFRSNGWAWKVNRYKSGTSYEL